MDGLDRLSKYLRQLVAKAVSHLAYGGVYPYSVVSCNKLTQTVAARSLTTGMPDLVDVPIGSPGLVMELPPGYQIGIGFRGMDPTAPEVCRYGSGGIAPIVPSSGSGVQNEIDAGYILIVQLTGTPFTVAATYFPAGVAGSVAAELAHSLAPGSILLHMNGGRVLPNGWTVP